MNSPLNVWSHFYLLLLTPFIIAITLALECTVLLHVWFLLHVRARFYLLLLTPFTLECTVSLACTEGTMLRFLVLTLFIDVMFYFFFGPKALGDLYGLECISSLRAQQMRVKPSNRTRSHRIISDTGIPSPLVQ